MNTGKIILALLIFYSINPFNAITQEKFEISGFVKDSETGEVLIGALVYTKNQSYGCVTNNHGFYSLSLTKGKHVIIFSYLSYKKKQQEIELTADIQNNVSLTPESGVLHEVNIIENRILNQFKQKSGSNSFTGKEINSIPNIGGEPDLLKSLQFLPGVSSGNEGFTNMNVRGGGSDQNLVLIDGAPIFNLSHMLGLFSSFDNEMINYLDFYKGHFPAAYGGRLSSITNIRLKEGNSKQYNGNFTLGTLNSKILVEGPVIKDKASFIVSARYNYAGSTYNNFLKLAQIFDSYTFRDYSEKNVANFYDLYLKFNYSPGKKDRLFFSAYKGHDNFSLFAVDNGTSLKWGNMAGALRWNHCYSGKIIADLTLYYSKYNYKYGVKNELTNYTWLSGLGDFGIKYNSDIFLENHRITFGASFSYKKFNPGETRSIDTTSNIKTISLDNSQATELSIFAADDINFKQINIYIGFRATCNTNIGPGTENTYSSNGSLTNQKTYGTNEIYNPAFSFEPRIAVGYNINQSNSFKISYNRSGQNIALLSNSSIGMPTDIWLPAGKNVKCQNANMFSGGYFLKLNNNISFSIESYTKRMSNIVDFKDNAILFMNKNIEAEILTGKSYSKGIEFFLDKKGGNFNGWVAYTLSNTKHKIKNINSGSWFSPRYDKKHIISLVANYNITKRFKVSASFKYSSGSNITIPINSFVYDRFIFYDYSNRNSYKLPDFHRLDLSITWSSKDTPDKRIRTEKTLCIYNIYDRKNPFSIYIDNGKNQPYKMSLFGIVPSFTYKLYF